MIIDLNLDAGEDPTALADGREAALYDLVTSVNIACGGHAGDAQSMDRAVRLAHAKGLAIGAHPSYPDRDGFGRSRMNLSSQELHPSLLQQIQTLQSVCAQAGVSLAHVKPHGALYNLAAFDADLATTIAQVVYICDPTLLVVGLAGSTFLRICEAQGLKVRHEAFVDRRYLSDGRLQPRSQPGAVITDPDECAHQAVQIACLGYVDTSDATKFPIYADTLCIHGDTAGAIDIANAVRTALLKAGVRIAQLQPG